ncbi:hypothetical protein M378DRAFT_13835 [Amanita muscaria Koide BX008]|uniref:RING-type domain-containing protein n=1 Tax=Amanita muscaria (strain Koide BX008) TaxID=946122 RepID=A0A0C2WHF5_AMAMK|nr:hypothetical protein M378DRAFT_13835 [Amanita muscaria Koide BX008]
MSFQSFSVPSSPAMTRSSRASPVTPQRLPRQHQHQRHSQSLYKSPTTPSTVYSPLSLRSATSIGSSTLNTPDTNGLVSKRLLLNSCSPLVAKTARSVSGRDRSLADIAENWRSRASENGIKVSSEVSCTEGSNFGDDEASERTLSDSPHEYNVVPTAEALLPPPFLTNQRRSFVRPRSQTHATITHTRASSSPTISRANRTPSASPVMPRRSSVLNQSENIMATPPPNRNLSNQLKIKGSLTDPAQPRRREAFGVVRTPSQNVNAGSTSFTYGLNPNTSLDLFDIDEGDFESDYESSSYPRQDCSADESFSLDVDSISTDLYGYPSYPLKFSQPQFADPFPGVNTQYGSTRAMSSFQARPLGAIAENVEYQFQGFPQDNYHAQTAEDLFTQGPERNYYAFVPPLAPTTFYTDPQFVPYPAVPFSVPHSSPIQPTQQQPQRVPTVKTPPRLESPAMPASVKSFPNTFNPTDCSVCLVKRPRTLAILQPCGHPLCSACLTSALNIVGEKDMECAVCKRGVDDFRLTTSDSKSNDQDKGSDMNHLSKAPSSSVGRGETPDSVVRSVLGLQTLFEFGLEQSHSPEHDGPFLRASTPKEEQPKVVKSVELSPLTLSHPRSSGKPSAEAEYVVLRIDNVPWDITPPQIRNWLQQPVERVHVLLDPKGKTLSHAYVEVKDATIAGAILRGEAQAGSGRSGKKERSSVLGSGRRARGVTVTKSGQEELMTDLFPTWRGAFDGPRPSLAGLDSDHVIEALEGGLMTENELKGLLYLIREPDSHFLKVPSLPFHSLMSILSKFPADVDSRVFWSANLRDLLYDVTYAAAQILLSRIREQSNTNSRAYSMELVAELIQTAVDCRVLASQQVNTLRAYAQQEFISLVDYDETIDHSTTLDSEPLSHCEPVTPGNVDISMQFDKSDREEPFDALAREFGVEAQLVQALAQRLAGLTT